MKFYLMRHAHAEEGQREDPDRSIDEIGELQCEVMRRWMKKANLEPDIIITSKFQRAIETAEAIQRKAEIKQTPALNPPEFTCDADTDAAWKAILKIAGDAKDVLVVTHGPLIEKLLASVAFGLDERLHFEHGSMCYVNTDESRLRWWMTPKLAAHITGEADPKDVENPPSVEEIVEALRESLNVPDRRAVVDPLIATVRKALRIRWRAQLRQLETNGLPLIQDELEARITTQAPSGDKRRVLAALPLRHAGFAKKLKKATQAAYDAGADRVAEQLPAKVAEAPQPPKKRNLPGPTREPEELEDDLDSTTEERVNGLLDHAFEAGLTYSALVMGARELFDGFDETRGETTALSEISGAYHDGGRDAAAAYDGEVEKLWETEDDNACEDCQANEDMDWIPEDAPFDSGDFEPPAHTNCRCSVSYRPAETEE